MARARILKPGFFTNEVLAELPFEGRLLFAGLWTLADKEGRLEDRPRRIKAALFPWDEVDVQALLIALEAKGFIDRYVVSGMPLIQIAKFAEHQTPHQRETPSILPGPSDEPRKGRVEASPRFPVSDPVSVSGSGSDRVSESSAEPPLLTFPTAGKPETWHLRHPQVAEWQALYEGLDVLSECRKALAWVLSLQGRKKTAGGMPKFLVGWLNRATDRRGGNDRRHEERGTGRREYEPWNCQHEPRCPHRAACAVVSARPKAS